jgi:hypothetical protein
MTKSRLDDDRERSCSDFLKFVMLKRRKLLFFNREDEGLGKFCLHDESAARGGASRLLIFNTLRAGMNSVLIS